LGEPDVEFPGIPGNRVDEPLVLPLGVKAALVGERREVSPLIVGEAPDHRSFFSSFGFHCTYLERHATSAFLISYLGERFYPASITMEEYFRQKSRASRLPVVWGPANGNRNWEEFRYGLFGRMAPLGGERTRRRAHRLYVGDRSRPVRDLGS
jgi:hypothetical protein